MRNITCLQRSRTRSIGWLAFCLWVVFSCGKSTVVPIIVSPDDATIIPPTLVSIQPTNTDQAELIVKAGFNFDATNWRLIMLDAGGHSVPLNTGAVSRLDFFNLTPYRAIGLVSGQSYRLRFDTRNAGGDSIHAERLYVHSLTGPRWVRLAHAPCVGGNFAATALSTDNAQASYNEPNNVVISRYVDDQSGQSLTYYTQRDSWYQVKTKSGRHSPVNFQLQAVKGVVYQFSGLGYLTNERLPGERVYLRDMYSAGSVLAPFYGGPDGVVHWFVTLTRAYMLTEAGSPQLWIRQGTWEQHCGPDLPEPTGTLATFRLGSTGYVINQRSSQPPHTWAFDTELEQWSRKADFPGPGRTQGISFTASNKGYFGLGVNADQQSLRDVWQYDPTTDHWQYVTDYPGAASTALAVGQLPEHTFLGLGYEQQQTAGGGIRLIGCTDFWEFKP